MAKPSRVVITGGAGFIGSNLAARFLDRGDDVVVLDNFSREGTRANAKWLSTLTGALSILEVDVRDFDSLRTAIRGADAVYHLAAQVAVTSSVLDPRTDFDINALGTFNVVEAVRTEAPSAVLVYSSTNKVYGAIDDWPIAKNGSRYLYVDRPEGVAEDRPLDFHSPYGCSKGTGDQYVRDYARIFNLKSVVLRQACIYGPHQFGNEDQGWVAHFMIQALKRRPITIFGDGLQVRDVLHVHDLVSCYELARNNIPSVSGEVFNIGGGPGNSLSLIELIAYLEDALARPVQHEFADWRPGDQRIYVSNIDKAAELLGWEPGIAVSAGLDHLMRWLTDHLDEIP